MLGVTHGTRYDGSHGARLSVLAIIDAALIIGTLGAGSAAVAARRGAATGARAGTGMLDDAARALIRCANSFSEDTVVATATGLLAISTLTAGSMVLAYNEATDTVDLYPVTQVHEHLDPVIILLTIDDNLTDDHPGLIIETTPEHPFYVAGTWVNAEDLTVGTVLSSFDGEQGILPRGTITSTARVEQEQMMYDLTVYTAHTFFVGDGQYLVHNTAPCQRAFAPGQWLNHYQKHMGEFPEFSTAVEYLRGAQNLTDGGLGIQTFTRTNGETLWYRSSTNEFAVLRSDGQMIKTYFKPTDGYQYWLNQTGGTGGVPSW